VTNLSASWQSAQVVRTKEKFCERIQANKVVQVRVTDGTAFLFGVMSLTFTCLLYGMAPEWLPFAYTAQAAFYLPTRSWTYKRKAWHYFLFGRSFRF
jgi:hypothetical protein